MSHVILVDDYKAFLHGLKLMVHEIPEVTLINEVRSGVQFLELIKDVKPDLVFLDIRMPDINGIEVVRKAIGLHADIRIIILTMFGEEQYLDEARASGVKGFLLKPPSLRQIREAYAVVTGGGEYFPDLILEGKS